MCGICGVIGPVGTAGAEDIRSMNSSLRHRGPDDEGIYLTRFDDTRGNFEIALGHTRLSILDLSTRGHQPMVSEDEKIVLVYNGEIYNFRELRAELEQSGHEFRSQSDTEVVLRSYQAWGLDCLSHFNGMFACAIWDSSKRRLILARDRLGIKPLYYRLDRETLVFGSELKALRKHRTFVPEIDRSALELFLQYGWTTGTESIYAGTYRVLPGNALIWQEGRLSSHAYWQIAEPDPLQMNTDFDSVVDRLDSLLGDAVEARLAADVPLGAFLSGGIDSSTVVALMMERAQGRVRTFSIGFHEEGFDEAPYAKDIARHLGTEHTELYVRGEDARQVLEELPLLYDEPFADSSAIPTVLLSRLAREDVTVALSGDGGDELFGGYTHYDKFERLRPLMAAPQSIRKLVATLARPLPFPPIRNGLDKLRNARTEADLAESFHTAFAWTLSGALCRRSGIRPDSHYLHSYENTHFNSPLRRAMYADSRTFLPDDILVKVDRATMSVGLEARVPILDHRIVEFAFTLPADISRRAGVGKAPLREVLYRRVPKDLVDRPKSGFGSPIRQFLADDFDHWMERYLAPARIAEEGIFDPDAVSQLVTSPERTYAPREARLWRLLCFQRWFERNHGSASGTI